MSQTSISFQPYLDRPFLTENLESLSLHYLQWKKTIKYGNQKSQQPLGGSTYLDNLHYTNLGFCLFHSWKAIFSKVYFFYVPDSFSWQKCSYFYSYNQKFTNAVHENDNYWNMNLNCFILLRVEMLGGSILWVAKKFRIQNCWSLIFLDQNFCESKSFCL